ncbi:MAG: TIGR01459 family HAD-type hydrolase [Pelagibacteraceae bacterium]
MKKLDHLSKIYSDYDTFIIDLWGVMHNGIELNKRAVEVIENLKKNEKRIIFLSNAPRPNKSVINFLKKIDMKKEFLENIMTSGEAAMKSLKEEKFGKKFFHLGPERDTSLFLDLRKNKTNLEECDFILCTGLFDNYEKNLEYYTRLLKPAFKKRFVCTNPDLIVHRGNIKEYCAGKIAEIFESLGGKVIYFGKPHKEVYEIILNKGEKNFIIGDNLNTDIKGANNLKIDSLFILNGVHKSEFNNENDIEDLVKKYGVTTKFYQSELSW